MSREKERAALLAGLPPMPECMVDETLAGAVSLANYLTAAIRRISTRQKVEAGFDRRIRFLSAALAENKKVMPMMARLRLRELPLTKGLLFASQWTPTVESTTKTQLLSVSQAQLAREQPSTSKQSGDRFRIPKKAEVRVASKPRRVRKVVDQTPRPKAVEEVEVPVEAVVGVEAEAPKRTPTPPIIPQNQPHKLIQNDQLCPVGGD